MRRQVGKKSSAKKPAKRKTTHRRRRVGAVSGGMKGLAMKAFGLGVGAVAGRELNAVVVKFVPTLSPMISGVLQAATGMFLPMVMKGNKLIADVGDGMIANGLMVVAVSTGVISGVNDRVSYQVRRSAPMLRVNGPSAGANLGVLGGTQNGGNIPVISGVGAVDRPARQMRRTGLGCV